MRRPSPPASRLLVHERAHLLALRMLVAALRAETFTPSHQPHGDTFSRLKWVRSALTPLAPIPGMRRMLRALDDESGIRTWLRPEWVRSEMQRLARDVVKLSRQVQP